MGEAVVPVEFRHATVIAGTLSEGFAIPDLTVLGPDVRARILYETVETAARESEGGANLAEALTHRFGPTAAGYLGEAVAKMLRADPADLDPSALSIANFGRVRLVPDDTARFLKKLPELDDRIAGPSLDDPFRYTPEADEIYPHRNFYPARMGMRGFCDAAERYLSAAGVDLHLETRIDSLSIQSDRIVSQFSNGTEESFDRIFWTADPGFLSALLFDGNPLADLQHPVPMVLFYFVVSEGNIGPYTYLHDYMPEHLVFRISAAGRYGRQFKPDGTTYICCEVTTEIGSPVWEDPQGHADTVWREALALGAVTGDRPGDMHVLKTPVSYRAGKPGYGAALKDLTKGIAALSPRIVIDAQGAFARNDILRDLRQIAAA
jgi:protoporphyrinogen oxidase